MQRCKQGQAYKNRKIIIILMGESNIVSAAPYILTPFCGRSLYKDPSRRHIHRLSFKNALKNSYLSIMASTLTQSEMTMKKLCKYFFYIITWCEDIETALEGLSTHV